MRSRFQALNDNEVVAIAQLGSLEACDELTRRFRGAILLVAEERLGRRDLAQDAAQEAFLLAFRSLRTLRDPAKFASWLYAIARHRAQRLAQRERRQSPMDAEELERLSETQSHTPQDNPAHAALCTARRRDLRACLTELPPEIRLVLQLFYEEEWTAARIAAFLSLPLTTVHWRLHSGRTQLCRRLKEWMEETIYVETRIEQRNQSDAPTAHQDGGVGGALGADWSLRGRSRALRPALQSDHRTSRGERDASA